MSLGLPYDGDAGRGMCAALSAMMTGVAYRTSAEMADELGAFPGLRREPRAYAPRHAQPSLRRLRPQDGYEGLAILPVPLVATAMPGRPLAAAAARAGTKRSRKASSTATATPRRP